MVGRRLSDSLEDPGGYVCTGPRQLLSDDAFTPPVVTNQGGAAAQFASGTPVHEPGTVVLGRLPSDVAQILNDPGYARGASNAGDVPSPPGSGPHAPGVSLESSI